MAGSGIKSSLAWWREARSWWLGESPVEFHSYIDTGGYRRQTTRELPLIASPSASGQTSLEEDHKEDWSLKLGKLRDMKVAAATGNLPQAYYEREAEERKQQNALREIAWSTVSGEPGPTILKASANPYVPLHIHSGYSFGRSTILAEEIAPLAADGGCTAAAIADIHSLTGAVEHVKACGWAGIKPLVGVTVELPEGGELVLIAKTKAGYRSLSRLVTECHLGEPRSFPLGSWERLSQNSKDVLCLTGGDNGPIDRLLVAGKYTQAEKTLRRLIGIYGRENVFIEIERSFLPWTLTVGRRLLELAESLNLTPVAGGSVTHARPDHFPAQDALVCAHTLCTIEEVIGRKLPRDPTQPQAQRYPERALNAERYLRSAQEMSALFRDRPFLLENTLRVADLCDEDVLPPRTTLPNLFEDDSVALREIVNANAYLAYGDVQTKHRRRLNFELDRIIRLGYATHFLIAWDFCRWAKEQNIQMSGRGSVVDSAVSYVLGFSRIDAIKHSLHFDRFLPADGSKRPDIDIDFESKRRDDIRGYITGKYGIERVATVAAIGTYSTRGIVREIGKVMELPPETISFLAKRIHGGVSPDRLEAALFLRPELRDSSIPKEKFRWVLELAYRLMDIPRNARTHSSGVVVSSRPIWETVPVMWSATPSNAESRSNEDSIRMIQLDKRTAKYFFDKFDILCLRAEDILAGVEVRIRKTDPDFSADKLQSASNPEVYRAMRSGELIGITQSASPAMRQAHVRLRTDNLHDASLVQAGIRPGVGGAVKLNELIARRRGKPYEFAHPLLEKILGGTYGIIVFQEQVDQLLQAFCGYTGGEAEDIRDQIHKRRKEDYGAMIREKLIAKIVSKGFGVAIAEQVFEYIAGFKGYGFAQGHALAFAETSLRSVELMQEYPAQYFAALLSAQPAGYYGPATIANEARNRGVPILGLDINKSREQFQPEEVKDENRLIVPSAGIRVAWMQLSGLSDKTKTRILEYQDSVGIAEPARDRQPLPSIRRSKGRTCAATIERTEEPNPPAIKAFSGFFDFVAKVHPDRDELEALILSGAFDSVCPNRRALLWVIPQAQEFARLHEPAPGVLQFDYEAPSLDLAVTDFTKEQKTIYERSLLGMDVSFHLMAYERERVAAKGAITAQEAQKLTPGAKAFVVGNPIRLRFPPTQSGKRVVFFDLEDETGLLNVTCFDDVYMKYGKAIVTSPYATVLGEFQDRGGYPAFLANAVFTYKPTLETQQLPLPIPIGDFLVG